MRWRIALISLLLVTCVGCDQATKLIAIDALKGEPQQTFLFDMFRLVYAENTGAFLGLGAHWPAAARLVVLSLFVPVVLGGLLFAALSPKATMPTALALTLLVGGGAGNLIDRVWRDGRVVDFMNMGIGPVRTGIFNVADVQLMVGVFVLVGLSFLTKKAAAPADDAAPQS